MANAERIGYTPDHPEGLPASTGIDWVEWFVDARFERLLFDRVRAHLPQSYNGGRFTLAGLNRHGRLFRYSAGAVYRPHIDGSWSARLC